MAPRVNMLKELLERGYGKDQDLCCSEKILYGANEVYNLELGPEALKVSAGFCGGMYVGSVCGVVTASQMVLGRLFVTRNAHGSPRIRALSMEFFRRFHEAFDALDCSVLKPQYREQNTCSPLLLKAAEILDDMIQREQKTNAPLAPRRDP